MAGVRTGDYSSSSPLQTRGPSLILWIAVTCTYTVTYLSPRRVSGTSERMLNAITVSKARRPTTPVICPYHRNEHFTRYLSKNDDRFSSHSLICCLAGWLWKSLSVVCDRKLTRRLQSTDTGTRRVSDVWGCDRFSIVLQACYTPTTLPRNILFACAVNVHGRLLISLSTACPSQKRG